VEVECTASLLGLLCERILQDVLIPRDIGAVQPSYNPYFSAYFLVGILFFFKKNQPE
jgi:hypothetical protein